MPETRGIPEPEQTVAERAVPVLRNVIAGHPQGAVRRIVLYVIGAASIVASASVGGGLGLILAVVAVIAVLLLALTDQLA